MLLDNEGVLRVTSGVLSNSVHGVDFFFCCCACCCFGFLIGGFLIVWLVTENAGL